MSENAVLNHLVEKLLIGSVGMLPALKAKTTSTTSGAYRNRTSSPK